MIIIDLPSRNPSLSGTAGLGRSTFLEKRDVILAKNSKAVSPKLDVAMASKHVPSMGVSDYPIHVAPATGVGKYSGEISSKLSDDPAVKRGMLINPTRVVSSLLLRDHTDFVVGVAPFNISSSRTIGSFNIMVPSEYLDFIFYKSLWPVDILLKEFTSWRKSALPVAHGPPASLSSVSIASKSLLPTSPARLLAEVVRRENCQCFFKFFPNTGLKTRIGGGAEILIIRCLELGGDVPIATHSSLTASLVDVYNAENTMFIAIYSIIFYLILLYYAETCIVSMLLK
uniref:Uncharacterized protein n=1 Tax=Glossina austeni TaxID=7395 RepID=A0A1A9VDB0_GLOAU